MLEVFVRLYNLLTPREKRSALLLFCLLLTVAIAEVLGVASIMPFIAVLLDPDIIDRNRYLSLAYTSLNFASRESFTFWLGVGFLAILVGSLSLKALGIWRQLRFTHMRNHSWSSSLVASYLARRYEWFLSQNTSKLAVSVLTEVAQVVNGALAPAIQAVAQSIVVVLLLLLLLAADPFLAIGLGGVLGATYAVLSIAFQRKLKSQGKRRLEAQASRFRSVQESFLGIKEVKIAGLEQVRLKQFEPASYKLATYNISSELIRQLPFLIMQGLLFGGMLAMLLYLMARTGGFTEALPLVALYAFGAYRLLPALQELYRVLATLQFNEAVLDALSADLKAARSARNLPDEKLPHYSGTISGPRNSIELRNVTYSYPSTERPAVRELSIRIPAHTTVGFVGATGSGKTTTIDLLLGLLEPTQGALLVDEAVVSGDRVRKWQRSLGYVPQHIFLIDDTVEANVAFGLPSAEIDQDRVRAAAKAAHIHDFISERLPKGYETEVGDRGIRLSGGQRQRIGIARALYHDPAVLVLDEATSALDPITERKVMKAIRELGGRKTILVIAHRLSTVRNCDTIFYLDDGQLVGQGDFSALQQSSARFRLLAEEPQE